MADDDVRLAPVTPIFGGVRRPHSESDPVLDDAETEPDAQLLLPAAEDALVRRLRSRQLSVAEARAVLRENGLDRESIDDVIDDFEKRSYLDDRTLAASLVSSGSERKGQGRVVLARTLAQRGLDRDVIDEALSELPDDDDERALEFARGKAPGMTRLDYDTALRRLHGQLARRGYGGSVAMNAARTALNEVGIRRTSSTRTAPGRPSGVRFIDSD